MESTLKETAVEVFSGFQKEFESFQAKNPAMVKSHSLGLEPRVIFDITSKDSMEFQVRMTIPYDGLSRTENLVIRNFLKKVTNQGIYAATSDKASH